VLGPRRTVTGACGGSGRTSAVDCGAAIGGGGANGSRGGDTVGGKGAGRCADCGLDACQPALSMSMLQQLNSQQACRMHRNYAERRSARPAKADQL